MWILCYCTRQRQRRATTMCMWCLLSANSCLSEPLPLSHWDWFSPSVRRTTSVHICSARSLSFTHSRAQPYTCFRTLIGTKVHHMRAFMLKTSHSFSHAHAYKGILVLSLAHRHATAPQPMRVWPCNSNGLHSRPCTWTNSFERSASATFARPV